MYEKTLRHPKIPRNDAILSLIKCFKLLQQNVKTKNKFYV